MTAPFPTRTVRDVRRRPVLGIVALVGLLLALTVAALALSDRGGSGLEADGPGGTLGFQRYLQDLGVTVRTDDAPPAQGTFLLLADLRSERQAADLLDWVDGGGRLVVADPGSAVLDLLDVETVARVGGGVTGITELAPGCVVPELAAVERVVARVSDRLLAPPPSGVACLGREHDAGLLVTMRRGLGHVVLLGGRSVLTNELLSEADNARLARQLLTTPSVTLGGPDPPAVTEGGLWEALPARARASAVGLLIAALAYVVARARRHGRPPDETALSPLPASALVDATAALYRSSGDRGHVADLLRERTVTELRGRLGLPRDAPLPTVIGAQVESAASSRQELEALLGARVPRDDDDLLRLAAGLDRLVGRHDRTEAT